MSDNEDMEDDDHGSHGGGGGGDLDAIADDEEQVQQNPVEHVEDSCERNQNSWLRFPAEFIRPAKMCSINKYVQCVDQGFLQHSTHHIPTGAEFVLVGHDSPSLPTHMFHWIWAMSQINLMRQYSGCVVPVAGLTDVSYTKKGKQLLATNIKRRLVISQAWQMDDQMRLEGWFADMGGQRETVMMESIQELRAGHNFYADVTPIQMLWGIVPVEYTLNGAKVRRIFHVLKTIPAPGFDLMRCLVDLSRKGDQKMPNGVSYAKVMQVVHEVINYECNRNLHIVGFFGRSHPLPHPTQVMDDPSSPMNPQTILSPFMVLRKILLQLPVKELSELVVDGFPKTVTRDERDSCFQFFKSLHTAYRRRLAYYHRVFARALATGSGRGVSTIQPAALPLVLSSQEDECLDQVYCFMNMTFNLNKWLDGNTVALERAELLRMPQLAIATLTPFQYVTTGDVSGLEFIKAHIGDPGEDLDETKLSRKYSMDHGSWGDMPHAGMFKNARESIRTSLNTIKEGGEPLQRSVSTYQNYMRAQSTIHTQAILVDQMMSDRVLHCAQCLERLSGRMQEGVRLAFEKHVPGETARYQREALEAYPDAAYHLKLLHTMSLHNKHIRANAVNLTTLWAILVSDVLTHLGAHHETWNWMMYTVQVMGGAGHLRAMTDDHGSRAQVIFTSKPNSVGFNAIITKTFKALSTLVTELLPDLGSDFLEPLRFMKLDRTTRAGVESVSAVMFVNGVREQAPDRKTFMRPIIMDEGYRSMDAAALNGMVCSIPRDSDGGSGNILKAVDPGKGGGAHLQGHQRQIPGLSPFLLAMTSNSNPHTTVIGECIKTFSVVTAMFPAGAQPGGKLSAIHSGRKRKISDYQSSNTNSTSTMPQVKEEKEDLAWIMCVLMMAARQLALVNKTGQVNFEVNSVCRMFVEWVRNIIQQHFMSFFSSMLFLSYDRVIAGYLTRQVASTFMATCARHYAERDSISDAHTEILLDMESAPVTLHACNMAICNAVTHMADTNLLMINQLIRDKLQTPVVPVEFIIRLMSDDEIDMHSASYDAVFTWLSRITQTRNGEVECVMGYLSVPKLGTPEDYSNKEAFLELYFGLSKNNYYTYITAVRECCSKTFDLSSFLSMEHSLMDFTHLMSRLGVGGDGMLQGYQQQNAAAEAQRFTYLFTQSAQDTAAQPSSAGASNGGGAPQAPQQQQQRQHGISKCWVHIIQHLLITSIQGDAELHADNMFTFGANLTELILSRCAPLQSAPAGMMALESFRHVHEEVVPLHMEVSARPEYFVRTINDHTALESGTASELPALLGSHPPEDVMHLGAWIQLYSTLHNGERPSGFQCFPLYNGRPPELVMGRRYPLVGVGDAMGTIVLEAGLMHTTMYDGAGWNASPPATLANWWDLLRAMDVAVGPLIFRHHAVFRQSGRPNQSPVVALPQPDGQFLDADGNYLLAHDCGHVEETNFTEAHNRLLPIGASLMVKQEALRPFGIRSAQAWVLASVRYPNEDFPGPPYETEAEQCRLFVTVNVKDNPRQLDFMRVVCLAPRDCIVPDQGRERWTTFDYAMFAVPG